MSLQSVSLLSMAVIQAPCISVNRFSPGRSPCMGRVRDAAACPTGSPACV